MMNSNRTKSLRLHALYFINLFVFFSINDIEREREEKHQKNFENRIF